MALSTVADIRATGGLDFQQDYRLFRLPDEAALDDIVQTAQARAVAWLKTRTDSSVYTGSATADTDVDELFRGAEELVALHFLCLRLKARKVFGTPAPFLQEDSSRFAELIDTELLKQAELLIDEYITVDSTENPFVYPAIAATDAVDRDELLDVGTQYQALIDGSIGLVGVSE